MTLCLQGEVLVQVRTDIQRTVSCWNGIWRHFWHLRLVSSLYVRTVKESLGLLWGWDGQGLQVGGLHVSDQLLHLPFSREDSVLHLGNLQRSILLIRVENIFMFCSYKIPTLNVDRNSAVLESGRSSILFLYRSYFKHYTIQLAH